ncbi:MAG: hypothetical protein Q9207_003726 [Kuettlingeria erythrocarpa]
MLLDILFIYCKLNRDVGYRQGMHEVLAPLLWVISRDAIEPEGPTKSDNDESPESKLISECLNPRFVEEDTFTLFGIIMQTVKSFYETGTATQTTPSPTASNSPIVERSRRVHEVYLRQADPDLADHLSAIGILPQIFLIRWMRLLFGREFPLEDVLTVWDTLFAEDPILDLVDLVCVSMLLRVRWQLLTADYSEALTLLLRYPVPASPNGPPTLVLDALYLRQNLMEGGGAQIVNKYSEALPERAGEKVTSKQQSAKHHDKQVRERKTNKSLSPGRSAAKFLHEQGGIDSIIQEAAKGVYSRGEKWGVNKALRGAVEGLQSGANFPRRQLEGSRWSLDEGSSVPSHPSGATDAMALEQRGKGLAKLLDNAITELWEQQRQCSNGQDDTLANALSLAIAKVQFVQVYLENPSMPFTTEGPSLHTVPSEKPETAVKERHAEEKPLPDPQQSPEDTAAQPKLVSEDASKTQVNADLTLQERSGTPASQAPDITVPKSRPQPLPFHRPRPSLAQSSFSWMLGEGQRKSSFVSPSPLPSDKRAAKEKADHLLRDGKADREGKNQKGKGRVIEESEEDEVINLGVLKGNRDQ